MEPNIADLEVYQVVFEPHPLDLTELIARENGLSVDENGFKVEMEAQKNRSRNAAQQETDDWVEIRKIEQTEFLGYDSLETEIRIARYRKVTQKKKTFYQLVFDQTPFYGESGGQVGDMGYIESDGVKTSIELVPYNITKFRISMFPATKASWSGE